MTNENLAIGRDICDRILIAVGASPDLLSTNDRVEICLSVGELVKIRLDDETESECILTTSLDAFNNLVKFCNIPNQERCTWVRIVLEKDCIVTLDISSHLELKNDEQC